MRFFACSTLSLLSLTSVASAASGWTFSDASITVQGKGAGIGGGTKEALSPSTVLPSAVKLASADTLKIILTTKDGNAGKKPHQAFLTLAEPSSGLEESFAFSVKENGKAKVELAQKDLPYQLLTASDSLKASIVIGSFGSSTPLQHHAFDISIDADSPVAPTAPSAAERYTTKPSISHIFRDDPRSPPKIISLVFSIAVLAALPALFGVWLALGGNVSHFGKAFSANPIAHGLFLAGILSMEGVFFLYYVSWNLFQVLPAAAIVAAVTYVSGSRALTEVQDRRLAGER